jgi:hypothetical protein
MSQKLVDGKVNLIVQSAVGGIVENNVEKVYDFIIGEDVVTRLIIGKPVLENYDIIAGSWEYPGAQRWLNFEGDQRMRETVNNLIRPYLFEYQLEEFSDPALAQITDIARAHWTFVPVGPRTSIKWYYEWRARMLTDVPAVQDFVTNTWHNWMTTIFAETKRRLDRSDVYSA